MYLTKKYYHTDTMSIVKTAGDTRRGEVLLAVNNKFTASQMSSPPDLN